MVTSDEIIGYFLSPTAEGVYTPTQTILFAIVLLAAVYVIYEILKKLNLKVNRELAIGVSPYVILGGTLRVIQDLNLFSSYWLRTPGIYVLMFGITFATIIISLIINRRYGIPYFKPLFLVGILLLSIIISYIPFVNFQGLLLVSLFYLPWLVIFYKIRWSVENKIVTLAQMFDATATFVAINFFGYMEKHVVPSLFINLFSPVSFIFLKIIGIVVILLLIDRFTEDKEFSKYLKLIIGILGAGTGVRDFIRLIALT